MPNIWFLKYFLGVHFAAAEGGGGGSGGASGDGKTTPPDHAAENAALKAEIAALKAASDKKVEPPKDDPSLIEKARLQREADEKKSGDVKAIERALTFSLKSQDFLKQNQALLPKDVSDIFSLAEKENYASVIEKDAAIKAGIVQSFFSIQANVDLLTPGVRSQLDDYLKLTKTGKQEKAQAVYESIFEPAFDTLKRIKKAEAVQKGHGSATDDETAYINRLTAGSRRHYLGEAK